MLLSDISSFKHDFPKTTVFSIGKSVQGRDIPAIKLGNGSRRIFICGAHHGLEWLTAKACITFAKRFAAEKSDGVSLFVVPMVNPDGVELAASGLMWQANARGVDLNHNYDALWVMSRHSCEKLGVTGPCSSKFGGEYPESEPESRAVANFTRQNNFDAVFALHSQGEVVYYDFCGKVPQGTEDYLARFEAASCYVRDLPEGTAVYGGYKDWFIRKFKKPGFTIEIGLGKNPLPLNQFDEVYSRLEPLLFECVKQRQIRCGRRPQQSVMFKKSKKFLNYCPMPIPQPSPTAM